MQFGLNRRAPRRHRLVMLGGGNDFELHDHVHPIIRVAAIDIVGNLSVGSDADVAVLHLEKGKFGFVDTNGARMAGNEKLICELTVRDGRVVWDLNGISRENWTGLGQYSRQGSPVWDGTIIDP